MPDPLKRFAILIHILHGKRIENEHYVDIAGFIRLATQIAALKSNVKKPFAEIGAALGYDIV